MWDQLSLFGSEVPGPTLPEGFKYQANVLPPGEEKALLEQMRELPFKEFEFPGSTGKRRVVSFGWRYDFSERVLEQANDIPPFLLPVREIAAAFANLAPDQLQHVLVTEYGAGAAIGWHRDKAVFGDVIGISLRSSCIFRLRRKAGDSWDRIAIEARPRSIYLLSGPSRTEWEHSIPPVDA